MMDVKITKEFIAAAEGLLDMTPKNDVIDILDNMWECYLSDDGHNGQQRSVVWNTYKNLRTLIDQLQ